MLFKKKESSEEKEPKVKKKRKKVKRADLQENIKKIKESMDLIAKDIYDLTGKLAEIDLSSEEGRDKYKELRTILDDKNNLYSIFQKELEQEYTTLKKMNDSGRSETWMKGLMIGGEFIMCFITLAVNRENPAIMKLMDFIMKRLRPPMKF